MRRAFIGLVLAATCFSQHAEIYRLSDADAKQGERLYEAMLNAEGDYKKWSHKMAYKVRDLEVDEKNNVGELEFSADFTTAVPSGGSGNTANSNSPFIGGSSTYNGGWVYSSGGNCYSLRSNNVSYQVPCK